MTAVDLGTGIKPFVPNIEYKHSMRKHVKQQFGTDKDAATIRELFLNVFQSS